MTKNYLLLPHIVVHNANALSSGLTIGTPALTAFLGFVHAIERKIYDKWSGQFSKVGICIHKIKLQTYRGKKMMPHQSSAQPTHLTKRVNVLLLLKKRAATLTCHLFFKQQIICLKNCQNIFSKPSTQ